MSGSEPGTNAGGDYLWDRRGTPDPDVEHLERVLGIVGRDDPPPFRWPAQSSTPPRRLSGSFVPILLAQAAGIAILAGAAFWIGPAPVTSMDVTTLAGTPTIGAQPVADRAQLAVGQWLVTDNQARANIDVGTIGRVEVDPGSRVALLSTRTGDYRLRLDRGTMHALIWAPPGQFFVETSSATAVDLGCAYTLTVDDEGTGLVRVTSGWVGFEWRGRESFIPAGAVCHTRRGLGPGTPHRENTSPAFRAALDTIDLGRGPAAAKQGAFDLVLAEAQAEDAFTLWHLLTRVEVGSRDRVFDRLAGFVSPPAGVTREGVRRADRDMLDQWWDALGLGAANWWRVWKQPWRDGVPKAR